MPYKDKHQISTHRRERNRATLNGAKAGGCVICGEKRLPCLDFHHVSGEKGECLSRLKERSDKKVKAELEKCVVLCANCHRWVHYGS